MNYESKSGELIRGILAGGLGGAVFGGVVAFGLAFIFADGIMLSVVMALQGALTGGMGLAWAVAMQLSQSEGKLTSEAAEIIPTLVSSTGKQVPALRRVA